MIALKRFMGGTLSVLYDQVDDWQRQADGFIQKDRPASVGGPFDR